MANRLKGITLEFGGDVTNLSSALKGLDSELKNTQSQLRDVDKLLKLDPNNTELLRQKHKLLADAVGDTKERLDKLKEARKEAEKNLGNYDEWKSKYEPLRTEIDKTSDKLNKLKAARDEMEKSGDINSDAYKQLQAEIGDTETKLKDLRKQQKDLSDELGHPISPEQYDSLKREIIDTENKLKDLEKQAGASTVALQKIAQAGTAIKTAGDKITDAGKALAPVSAGAALGLGAAAKAAIDYETAFTGVMKTNDELIDENGNVIVSYEDLSDAIKDLSTRTAASKTEIAAVMEGAGQLGVGTEYLADFTEAMVMLGDTTNLSADEAATANAKFANITNMSLDNAGRLGATLVDLGNNFATDEKSIMEMATRLAGAGHQIGLTESEILGFATALSSVGIEAEMGGSAFSKAMIKMQVATETGSGAMAKINERADDFNAKINRTIAELKAKIADLQQQRNALADQGKTGTDADKEIESQIKETEKLIKSFDKELRTIRESGGETGVTLRGLQMLMYNNSKDFKGFADNIGLTAKELTDLVNSASQLENFAEVAQMSVDEFTELFQNDAPAAMDAFIRGLGDTDAAGESTIQMLQDMGFTEVRLRDTLTRAASAQDLFSNAVKAGNDAWNENTALSEEAEKRYGTTEAKLSQLKETLSNLAIDLGEVLLPLINDIIGHLKTAIQWFSSLDDGTKERIVKIGLLVAALAPLLTALGSVISTVGTIMTLAPKLGAAMTVLSGPVGIAVAAVAALAAAFITAYKKSETFRNGVNKVVGWIVDKLNAVKNWGKDLIDNFVSGISDQPVIKAVTGIAKAVYDFLHFSEPEKGPLSNFHTFAPDMVKTFADGITDNKGLVENAADTVAGLVRAGLETVKDKLADVKTAWENKWNEIKTASHDAGEKIAEKCGGLNEKIETFKTGFSDKLAKARDAVKAFREDSAKEWDAAAKGADTVSSKLASAFDSVRKSANDMKDKVVNAFGTMRDSIADKIKAAKSWGTDLIANFTGGISENMERLETAVDGMAQTVADRVGFSEPKKGPLSKFHTFAPDMMSLFADGIRDNLASVTAATDDIANAVRDALTGNNLASLAYSMNAATEPIRNALGTPLPSTYSYTPALQNASYGPVNAAYGVSAQARRPAPVTFTVNNNVGGQRVAQLQYQYDADEQSRRGASFIKKS